MLKQFVHWTVALRKTSWWYDEYKPGSEAIVVFEASNEAGGECGGIDGGEQLHFS